MAIVYLSLGTNLGNRKENLDKTIEALGQLGKLLKCSSFIETEPWHFSSPNHFLNATLCLSTLLSPLDLLMTTQQIEKNLGRIHKTLCGQYQDRIIDIDILFYDDIILQMPVLSIPHPLLHKRRFVLQPLAEIAPEYVHPVFNKSIASLLKDLEIIDCKE